MRRKLKHFIYSILNPTFSWNPKEGLNSLKRKMNLYFYLHKNLRDKYKAELQFIHEKSSHNILSYIFPYPFISDFSMENTQIFKDEHRGLFYVVHKDKRLYLKRDIDTEDKVRVAYYCALIEQHKESPHCYLNESYYIDGGVVLDVGSAEGLLGLMHIEKIEKLYLFEVQKEWIEALQATFDPWKDKVVIVNKYVSDINDDDCVTLDTMIKDEIIELIKIDVEGAELKIFAGATDTLNKTRKLCVCTYHKNGDEDILKNYLEKRGFSTSFSNNVTLFVLSKLCPPYFRKCLIRAEKW